jgi:CheY-like chemotaxis protein
MARAPDGPLTMTVADTGVGMTAEQQALVFEDFVQADSSVTRRFGGTGLGMAITRRLVTLMDGRIDLDSAPGQGTTVRAMLPLAEAPAAPALPRPSANADALQGRHVLIADDNETNRFILKAMLESLGLCVSVAEDGRQAVDMARERRFDAILTDISMPGLDGEGARAQIRADQARAGAPRTPIAAVTAHALTHQVEGFLAAGFDAHVAKPLRVETLRQTLLDLLAAPSGDGDDAAASDRAAGGDG